MAMSIENRFKFVFTFKYIYDSFVLVALNAFSIASVRFQRYFSTPDLCLSCAHFYSLSISQSLYDVPEKHLHLSLFSLSVIAFISFTFASFHSQKLYPQHSDCVDVPFFFLTFTPSSCILFISSFFFFNFYFL